MAFKLQLAFISSVQIKQLKSEVTKQTKVNRYMEEQTQELQVQLDTAKEEQDKEKAEIEEFRKELEEKEKMMKEKAEQVCQLCLVLKVSAYIDQFESFLVYRMD